MASEASTEQSAMGEQQLPKAQPEKMPPLTHATITWASAKSADSDTASGRHSGNKMPCCARSERRRATQRNARNARDNAEGC